MYRWHGLFTRHESTTAAVSLSESPGELQIPRDDGAAAHLQGALLPDITLVATNSKAVNLSTLGGLTVIYVYPMTGRPDVPLPDDWDEIPGLRGCTPQSCGFCDHYSELQAFSAFVFGLSTQTSEYQKEAKSRLHLPFELLSDVELSLKNELRLPTFEASGMTLYKRLTMITEDAKVKKVFYPVFPPNQNADQVLRWLRQHA